MTTSRCGVLPAPNAAAVDRFSSIAVNGGLSSHPVPPALRQKMLAEGMVTPPVVTTALVLLASSFSSSQIRHGYADWKLGACPLTASRSSWWRPQE